MKYYIAIAGNIGAGKTTLARKLAEYFQFERVEEPFVDNPYLEKFYTDMRTWAFRCELAFLHQRLQHHLTITAQEHSVIQDRTIYEGAEIFAKNSYLNQHMTEADWQTYIHLYENLRLALPRPDLIIYLRSSVDRCQTNMRRRGRELETGVSREYLAALHDLYENWRETFTVCPILTADANLYDYKHNDQHFNSLATEIFSTLERLKKV
jgi:deoxyadenosine/deoxycytidine kinase